MAESVELGCQVQHSEVIEFDRTVSFSGRVFQGESLLCLCHFNFGNDTFQANGNVGYFVGICGFAYFDIQICGTTVGHYESSLGYTWNLSCAVCHFVDSSEEFVLCCDVCCDCFTVGDGEYVVSSRFHCDFVGGVVYLLSACSCQCDVFKRLGVNESFSG